MTNLTSTEVNNSQILDRILTNTVRMLNDRGLIVNVNKTVEQLLKSRNDTMLYEIPVTSSVKKFIVKILPQKVTTVGKTSGISDFIKQYPDNPKIIIVNSISPKTHEHIVTKFGDTEVFMESELMMHVMDHILVSRHEIIASTDEEVDSFLKEYHCKRKNLQKILVNDRIARHYNAKIGNIVCIHRNSEISGKTRCYRLVVRGHTK